MKYDIIYDQKENRWMMEKSDAVYLILRGFLAEFADQFHRKPKIESLILGLDVWDLIRYQNNYDDTLKTLEIYDMKLPISGPDWSVHSYYIELNLS